MKIILFVSLLFSQQCICQTTFSKFIENSSVKWAADATDTFRFSQKNLSLLLRERFNKGEIKVSIVDFDADLEKRENVSKEIILNRIAPGQLPVNGETGSENVLLSPKYFDSISNNLVETKQVLYIESGRLQSFVPWVTTKFSVYSNSGPLGIANCFSTGFTISHNIKEAERNKAIPLGPTTTMIRLDTMQANTALKQLYGHNMIETLWPMLNNKDYEFYKIDSNLNIPFSGINMSIIDDTEIFIPLSDSLGNITGKLIKIDHLPLNLSLITKIELQQEWFYYSKKNIVFNNIRQLILYAHKWTDSRKDSFASPVLKIILR